MKKMICLLITAILFLVGCADNPAENTSMLVYSDQIESYDTESMVIPETNSREETSSTVQGEETHDGFAVKYKKYNHQGNNIVILHAENKTDMHYTVTINGRYLNADGSVKQTESKMFEGFAAGFSNYFIFNPDIPFDDFDYTMEFEMYSDTPASAYTKVKGVELNLTKWRGHEGELEQFYVGVFSYFCISHSHANRLYYGAHFLVLDKNDEIFFVDTQLMQSDIQPLKEGASELTQGTLRFMFYDKNVLWADVDQYVLPDELNGELTGIVAFDWIGYTGHY